MTTTIVTQWDEKYESSRRDGETHQSALEAASTAVEKVNLSNTILVIISEQRSKECDWIKASFGRELPIHLENNWNGIVSWVLIFAFRL
jgi:hypothetical protein